MKNKQVENGASQRGPLFRVSHAVGSAAILAIACLLSYWLITSILTREYSVSRDDDLLGGMWAVVATIFVYRSSYQKMARAVVSRTVATLVSFVACLAYLLFFPFHVVGMAALIGIIAISSALVRRSEDIVMAAITITVVLVIADISPKNAWIQPILRLVDTPVGISWHRSLVDQPRLGSKFETGAQWRVRAAPNSKGGDMFRDGRESILLQHDHASGGPLYSTTEMTNAICDALEAGSALERNAEI